MKVVRVRDVGPASFEASLDGRPDLVGSGETLSQVLGTIDNLAELLPSADKFEEASDGHTHLRLRAFPDIRGFGKDSIEARGDILLNYPERFCVVVVYNH